jgi:hypothetical protein
MPDFDCINSSGEVVDSCTQEDFCNEEIHEIKEGWQVTPNFASNVSLHNWVE